MNIIFGGLFITLTLCFLAMTVILSVQAYQEYIEFRDKRANQKSKLKSVK